VTLGAQAVIVIGVALASIALLWAARRGRYNERFASEVGEHTKAFDFLGTAFAVLLAFVVLEAYDSYNEAKRGAELEAQAVLELSRTMEAYDPEDAARMKGTLVCYGRAVIHEGWPAMRDEKASPLVNDWGARFREEVLALNPSTFIQKDSFRQVLIEQDERIEGRRTRLAEAKRVVPRPLWIVLMIGAALTIGWAALSASRKGSFLVQAAVVASVAVMVTSALLLVWFLDHPFSEVHGSITPIEMEEALETIAEEGEAPESIEPVVPCTADGEPLAASVGDFPEA
jgi:hypothetical protein